MQLLDIEAPSYSLSHFRYHDVKHKIRTNWQKKLKLKYTLNNFFYKEYTNITKQNKGLSLLL